jgi:cell division protein FtsL
MTLIWISIIGFMIYLLIKLVDIERNQIERQQEIVKYLKELEQAKYEIEQREDREKILKQIDDAEV